MTAQVICMFLGAAVCLAAPLALAVILILKRRGSTRAFILGIIAFSMSQLLIRIPLMGVLQDTTWFNMLSYMNPLLIALIAAVTAGLFEEFGRFFGLKLFLAKDELTWDNAFVFGLGHGGVEAFALVGIPYFNLIVETLSGKGVANVWNTPALMYLTGGVERVFAIALQIGFSMLVFYAVRRKKISFLIYAIAAHTLVDFIVPLLRQMGVSLGVWEVEAVVAVFAALAVIVIVMMKRALGCKQIEPKAGGQG